MGFPNSEQQERHPRSDAKPAILTNSPEADERPDARGTFFVLGKFAEKHPAVVGEIAAAGHEIACHGYGHVEVFRLTREQFAEDLRRGSECIATATGIRPLGYRAPDFSICGESLWALEVLGEQGYVYDTSICPIAKARYGIASWPRYAAHVRLSGEGTILELPITTLEALGRRIPVGGGYARLLPAGALALALRNAARQLNVPPVFYCHPYDFDPDEFARLDMAIPAKVRFHQGLGRRRSPGKLRRLLKDFECVSLTQAIEQARELPTIEYTPHVLDPEHVDRPPIFEGTQSTDDTE